MTVDTCKTAESDETEFNVDNVDIVELHRQRLRRLLTVGLKRSRH